MTQQARFGLVLSNRAVVMSGSDAQELLELAEIAEGSGAFAHVWVGDSILAKPRVESVTLLAAIAAPTHRVRLGVACMATLPSRDPVLLAHEWRGEAQQHVGRPRPPPRPRTPTCTDLV